MSLIKFTDSDGRVKFTLTDDDKEPQPVETGNITPTSEDTLCKQDFPDPGSITPPQE